VLRCRLLSSIERDLSKATQLTGSTCPASTLRSLNGLTCQSSSAKVWSEAASWFRPKPHAHRTDVRMHQRVGTHGGPK
jgi:hypothetical protein